MSGTTVMILGTDDPPDEVEKNLTSCLTALRFKSRFCAFALRRAFFDAAETFFDWTVVLDAGLPEYQ